jgi:membrane protease YdiL (CAAX protease family)
MCCDSEEILCRGYMLGNLMKSYNKYVALAISYYFLAYCI